MVPLTAPGKSITIATSCNDVPAVKANPCYSGLVSYQPLMDSHNKSLHTEPLNNTLICLPDAMSHTLTLPERQPVTQMSSEMRTAVTESLCLNVRRHSIVSMFHTGFKTRV
jgi:hypothetical protein